MITIIAGGRDYKDYFTSEHLENLKLLKELLPITKVIAGACRGVDKNAIRWARENNLPFEEFPADWSRGKKAGYERNVRMAKAAEAVILLPGGTGTRLMHKIAIEFQLLIAEIK